MYVVIEAFADALDDQHIYAVGDVYPRQGFVASPDRLEELSSSHNRCGRALIVDEEAEEGTSEVKEDAQESETDSNSSETTEAKKKPRKGQKKNA